eukprot:3793925-Pyramimonas_sp.AAC.1
MASNISAVHTWKELDNFSKQRDHLPVLANLTLHQERVVRRTSSTRLDDDLLRDPDRIAQFQE